MLDPLDGERVEVRVVDLAEVDTDAQRAPAPIADALPDLVGREAGGEGLRSGDDARQCPRVRADAHSHRARVQEPARPRKRLSTGAPRGPPPTAFSRFVGVACDVHPGPWGDAPTREVHVMIRTHRGWRMVALLAAVPLALAGALATASPASAGINGHLDSATPGAAAGTFDIAWTAGGTGPNYWLAFAPVASGLTTCNYQDLNAYSSNVTPLGWLGNYQPTVNLEQMSLTTPPSVKDWYSNDNNYPITPGGVYMICLFYEDMDQGGPLFAMAGSDATSTPPPDVLQQVGLPAGGQCSAIVDPTLNWAGVASGGWTASWAQWAVASTGGWVCTRTLHYSLAHAKYVVAAA